MARVKKVKVPKWTIRELVDQAGDVVARIKELEDIKKDFREKVLAHAERYKQGVVEGDKYIALIDSTASTDISLSGVWGDILSDCGLNTHSMPAARAKSLSDAFEIFEVLVKPDVKAIKVYYKADMDTLEDFMTVTKKNYNKVTYKKAGEGVVENHNSGGRKLRKIDV